MESKIIKNPNASKIQMKKISINVRKQMTSVYINIHFNSGKVPEEKNTTKYFAVVIYTDPWREMKSFIVKA